MEMHEINEKYEINKKEIIWKLGLNGKEIINR